MSESQNPNPDPKASRSGPPPRKRGGWVGVTLLLGGLLAFLAFAVWAFLVLWRMGGDTQMSIHGWIALGLAFVLTGALGGGLMWLAFYSSRKGWDDQVRIDEDAEN